MTNIQDLWQAIWSPVTLFAETDRYDLNFKVYCESIANARSGSRRYPRVGPAPFADNKWRSAWEDPCHRSKLNFILFLVMGMTQPTIIVIGKCLSIPRCQ
jgi:hypothetical protein